MRKLITTKAKAQAVADKCHQYLIDNNPLYAADVARGGTIAWCLPPQDLKTDAEGNRIKKANAPWFVWVKDEVMGALTKAERDTLV